MKLKYCLYVVMMVLAFSACTSDDDPDTDVSVISLGNGEKNDFDKYLEKVFTEPYNINFQYKLQDIESDMNYQLVPATYENSIRMANLVKYLCLDAYEEVAPKGFLKEYFPKMMVMVGSAAYRNNGTYVLGTAEGGLKITLYDINHLDITNVEGLYEFYFRTIFHEFSHILHQTKDYSTDFDKISATKYVGGSWNDAWDGKSSLEEGFISDYSSKEANEDFVELIAHYITNTEESWAAKIEPAGDNGKAILAQKLAIVKSYMKGVWQIDLDELRAAIQTRASKLDEQDLDNISLD